MKIKAEHYAKLEAALRNTIARHPGIEESYRKQGLSPMRFNWDALYASQIDGVNGNRWICDNLYPYMNDDHIGTALKRIMGNDGKDARHGGTL